MTYSHCHQCGTPYAREATSFPKTCESCGHIHYKNPIPVAVCLVPCEDGLLGVIRGIEPQKGKLALPGGYVDMETLEQACSRELLEETGVDLPARVWKYHSCHLTPLGNLLTFFEADIDPIAMPNFPYQLPDGAPIETEGFEIIRKGSRLAFPSHEAAAHDVLCKRKPLPLL